MNNEENQRLGLREVIDGDSTAQFVQVDIELLTKKPPPRLLSPPCLPAEETLLWMSTQRRPSTLPLPSPKMYFYSSPILLASLPIVLQFSVLNGWNLGYTRIILAGLSLHFMSYHPIRCTIAYCVSCLLDAVDGQAARALGQTSKFGAVLDMVTDRCALPYLPIVCDFNLAQMHHLLPFVLSVLGIPRLCPVLPVPHCPGFQQSLYAHV